MATRRSVSLKDVALFRDLSGAELKFLLDRAVSLHYAPGQSIFVEGDPCAGLYVTESTLLHIRKKDFQELCLAHPQVALKVVKVVGSRLRRMVDLINELSFTSVRHRLAGLLLRLAEDTGKVTERGRVFVLPSTNQELAAQIGTVR